MKSITSIQTHSRAFHYLLHVMSLLWVSEWNHAMYPAPMHCSSRPNCLLLFVCSFAAWPSSPPLQYNACSAPSKRLGTAFLSLTCHYASLNQCLCCSPLNLSTLHSQELAQELQWLLRLLRRQVLHRLQQVWRDMLVQVHARRAAVRYGLRGRLLWSGRMR